MLAIVTTTYRGPTGRTGSRIVATATLARSGEKVRVTRPWHHAEDAEENHRRSAFAALDKAGVIANAYVLDGFRLDGVGTWVARTGDANRLLRLAEDQLADLRAEYQRGEAEDMREKYLDAIRDEVVKAYAVVTFLKGNA